MSKLGKYLATGTTIVVLGTEVLFGGACGWSISRGAKGTLGKAGYKPPIAISGGILADQDDTSADPQTGKAETRASPYKQKILVPGYYGYYGYYPYVGYYPRYNYPHILIP